MSKLRAFADDNFSVAQKRCSFSLIWQKTLWEDKILVTKIFFYFPAIFSKAFFSRVVGNQELFGKGLQKEQECKESELYKVFFPTSRADNSRHSNLKTVLCLTDFALF